MRINRSRILLMLVTLLLGVLTVSGCVRTIGMARGWSGGTVADDTLFIGSMEGKLVALNATDGSRLGDPVALLTELPTGGFGCVPEACAGPTSRAVAIYGSPVVGTTLIYLGGYDGKVYAFKFEEDRLRNQPRWIFPPQGSVGGAVVGGLVVAHDKVYFGAANGKVYALDAADGFLEWVFVETGDRIWSTPVIDGDTLFIGSFDRKLYALNATDGTKKWDFETEGAIIATPSVYGNTVYVGSFDRHLYAVNVTSGKEVWRFPATDEEESKPSSWFWVKALVYNDVVYAGCLDGKVYVLRAGSGSEIRQYDLESPIISSPVLVDNLIIFATEAGTVYSIDTTNNRQQQLASLDEQVYAPLFASEGTVYVHTIGDSLYAIDVKSGEKRKFTLVTE